MKDILLEYFFQPERWEYALEKGVLKDIRRDQLIALTDPSVRIKMYQAIKDGKYIISPPHTALIPKDDPGEFRTVYVNEPIDRIFLSIANDLLFEKCAYMVHKNCMSYQKGTGCGKVVQQISKTVVETEGSFVGFKADLSKYFDSVPRKFIHEAFDKVESRYGHSALIDVLRKYYDCDLYFDTDGNLQQAYQSLKQGCAVASWLADVVLYDLDEKMSKLNGIYKRYSDDICFIGVGYRTAMTILKEHLASMDMKLNPKKVEFISKDKWFKFLGYSIKGSSISLSKNRLKTFQREIEKRTIKNRKATLKCAMNAVNNYLYYGNGTHSWATQILSVCNVDEDLNLLNGFVMDCLRAVQTKHRKVGGLGYIADGKKGVVQRGKGRNVKANKEKVGSIEGYNTILCMKKALITSKGWYNTLIRTM